jgi:hypothetical protein
VITAALLVAVVALGLAAFGVLLGLDARSRSIETVSTLNRLTTRASRRHRAGDPEPEREPEPAEPEPAVEESPPAAGAHAAPITTELALPGARRRPGRPLPPLPRPGQIDRRPTASSSPRCSAPSRRASRTAPRRASALLLTGLAGTCSSSPPPTATAEPGSRRTGTPRTPPGRPPEPERAPTADRA